MPPKYSVNLNIGKITQTPSFHHVFRRVYTGLKKCAESSHNFAVATHYKCECLHIHRHISLQLLARTYTQSAVGFINIQ